MVSTNLIEAGVDISFEYVYRSMAGLDSVAQAALFKNWIRVFCSFCREDLDPKKRRI